MASYVGNKPLFGNFDKLDDISSGFNGSANTFAMTSNSRGVTAGDETQVVISLNGVIQEPVTDYFLATTGQIQFTTAPASGTAFFGYVTGNIGGTASTITDGIVTTAKLANTAGTGSAVQLAANTTSLTIAANGNVGIGTTNPSRQLTVSNSGAALLLLESTGNDNGQLLFGDAASDTVGKVLYRHSDNRMSFQTNGTEHVHILSDGKVGINTNSPSSLLNIYIGSAADREALVLDANGGVMNGGSIDIRRNNTSMGKIDADYFEGMRFYVSDGGGAAATERMRIDAGGNVGIGTTNPDTKLHITGDFDNSSSKAGNNADKGLTITSSASGSTSYAKDNEFGIVFAASDGTSGDAPTAGIMTIPVQSGSYVGGHLVFQTHTSSDSTLLERMRIDSNGNVLVGKTSSAFGTGGIEIRGSDDASYFTRDGGVPIYINRLSSSGAILQFNKDGTTVGEVQERFGSIQVGSGETNLIFNNGSNEIAPSSSSGGVRDNTTDLGANNRRWKNIWVGGGVYLGGTGSANHLDDYEEGTFTPTLSGEGSCTITTSTALGQYNKVGRIVNVTMFFQVSAVSGGSTSLAVQISGLPFATNTNLNTTGAVRCQNLNSGLTASALQVNMFNNATNGRIEEWTGFTAVNLSDHITSSTNFAVSITYSIT